MWPVVTALNFTSLAATGPLPTDLVTTPVKWKWDDDLLNELLPDGPLDKAAAYGSLEFDEVLSTKFTVVNRAPLMTAWATVVAEHLGFEREENETWCALDNSSPALPSTASSYISRAFRQMTLYVIGALRSLAETFPPPELNNKGFGLYAEFRPDVDGWGKCGEVRCEQTLSLRKKDRSTVTETAVKGDVVKLEVNRDSRPTQG
ncbi:hypothetical protein EV424DRAFT_1541733 [Suillus variegatus]|nr:hypothetical protein EV424DRAFT_1541733 [Suillus variegatus]